MAEKFRNRYRISSTRLRGYDYTRNGVYFITICTRNKIPCFGAICDGEMILSETGIIVNDCWLKIQEHFPNICLDELIIMPDHLHGIIIINSKIISKSGFLTVETPNLGVSARLSNRTVKSETPRLGVSTRMNSGNPYWKSNSIGSIINQFKRICTIKTKSSGLDLIWQPRFYDRIIRSDNELNRIRTYIKDNAINWINDKNNID